LAYALTRVWFGAAAARVALIASLFAPETWMAAAIPTHDVPGALYLVLALAAFAGAYRLFAAGRIRAAAAASVGFSLLLAVVDLQRTTGPFLWLACSTVLAVALFSAPGEPRYRRRAMLALLLLAVLPAGVLLGAELALRHAGLGVPQELFAAQNGKVLAAGTESWSDGTWGYFHQNYELRYGELSLDWRRFAAVKLASDLAYNPGAHLGLFVRKAQRLFDLGTQTYFYVHDAVLAGGSRVEAGLEARTTLVSRAFSLLFLAGVVAGAWRFSQLTGAPLLAWAPLAYLAILAGFLILAGEVQPRYLYPVWYLGAPAFGLAIAGPGALRETPASACA
jgi:hypothetical protein